MNSLENIKLNDYELQQRVFAAIPENVQCNIGYIAQRMGLKEGQVARGLSLLESKGLVESRSVSKETPGRLYWRAISPRPARIVLEDIDNEN